jgi:hypothetical protein
MSTPSPAAVTLMAAMEHAPMSLDALAASTGWSLTKVKAQTGAAAIANLVEHDDPAGGYGLTEQGARVLAQWRHLAGEPQPKVTGADACPHCNGWGHVNIIPRDGGPEVRCGCANCQGSGSRSYQPPMEDNDPTAMERMDRVALVVLQATFPPGTLEMIPMVSSEEAEQAIQFHCQLAYAYAREMEVARRG